MFASIFFGIILVLVVYYFRESSKPPKGLENIPFVSSLPVTWALFRQRPTDELREIMTENSKGHDIYMTRFGWIKSITISSPEYVKDLLMAHEDDAPKVHYPTGSLSKFFGLGIPFSNGDRWRTYRKLSSPVFNSLSTDIVGETVFELFNLMQQRLDESINIFEIMQRTTIEAVGKLVFGYQFGCLRSDEIPRIVAVYRYLMEMVESLPRIIFPWLFIFPTKSNRKFSAGIKELDKFFYEMIEKKNNEMEKHRNNDEWVDILTTMLKLGEEKGIPFNAKELRDELAGYIVAGETTTMALCTSFYHLAKYPEIQEKARQDVIRVLGDELVIPTSEQIKEMKYIKAVIKESLRSYPPATAIVPRKLSRPMKIGPHLIPENTLCKVDIWQVVHHPRYWKNPNQYDPERFLIREKRDPSSWIPFSLGPRNCVGQNFSLMEQKVILSMFLLKYNMALPDNSIHKDKLKLESHVIPRPDNLRVVFTERK